MPRRILLVLMLYVLKPGSCCYAIACDKDQARLVIDAILRMGCQDSRIGWCGRCGRLQSHDEKRLRSRGAVERCPFRMGAEALGHLLRRDLSTAEHPESQGAVASGSELHGEGPFGEAPGLQHQWITGALEPGHLRPRPGIRRVREVADIPGPLEWANADFLAEQQRLLPESVYRRCPLNEWATGRDRLVLDEDLSAAIRDPDPSIPNPA